MSCFPTGVPITDETLTNTCPRLEKVKCTGEHDGCARCRNLNTECIYNESRVGKVQGPRSKRKRQHQRRDENPATGSAAGTNTNHSPYSPSWPNNTSRASQQQNVLSWSNPWGHNPVWAYDMPMMSGSLSSLDGMVDGDTVVVASSEIDSTGMAALSSATYGDSMDLGSTPVAANLSPPGVDRPSITTTSGAMLLAGPPGPSLTGRSTHPADDSQHATKDNSDSDQYSNDSESSGCSSARGQSIHNSTGPSLTLPSASPQPEKRQRPMATGPDENPQIEDYSQLDSHCVLSCVRVIGTLENYLLGSLKNLDLIMEILSRSGMEMQKLVRLQQKSRCDRCLLLFNTVIFQMIELLEAGAKPLSAGRADFLGGAGFFPIEEAGFGFGSLSPSTEEQRSWRSRIVRGACKHVGEVVSGVIGIAQMGPRGVSLPPGAIEQRVKCLVEMELKLKKLYEREGGEGPVCPDAFHASASVR